MEEINSLDDFLGVPEDMETGIKVTDKYRIDTLDALNVVVKELYQPMKAIKDENGKTIGKEPAGKPQWKTISYHANIEQAFKSICDTVVNLCIKDGIEKVIDMIKDLKNFKSKIVGGNK